MMTRKGEREEEYAVYDGKRGGERRKRKIISIINSLTAILLEQIGLLDAMIHSSQSIQVSIELSKNRMYKNRRRL